MSFFSALWTRVIRVEYIPGRDIRSDCLPIVKASEDAGHPLNMLPAAPANCGLKIGAELSSVAHFPQIAPRKQNVFKRHTVVMVERLAHGTSTWRE
jgi:hypothetical protein